MKYSLLICIFAVFFLVCNQPNESQYLVVSKNSGQSECVGLLALQDTARIAVDTAQYCWAERLYWSYTGQQVQLLHTRKFYTCLSKVTMQVIKNNNVYVIREEASTASGGVEPLCVCPYDAYCEFPADTNTITLQLGIALYQIDLTKISGCFVLDTQARYREWCYPRGYPPAN